MPDLKSLDAYSGTVDRLEPDLHPVDTGGAAASIAVSLKRIADALDRVTTQSGIVTLITTLKPALDQLEKEGRI